MSKKYLHIIPFEKLLDQLRHEDGFRISIDTYQKLNHLLNQWKADKGEAGITQLKVQLGVLLAHNAEEQARFYERFEAYVRAYTYQPPTKDDNSIQRKKLQWAFGVVAGMFSLFMLGYLYYSLSRIQPKVAWQQAQYDYTVWLADLSANRNPFDKYEEGLKREWKVYQDSVLLSTYEGKNIQLSLEKAGSYQVKLFLSDEALIDSLSFPVYVSAPWIPAVEKNLYGTRSVVLNVNLLKNRPHIDETLSTELQEQIADYEEQFPTQPTETFLWQSGDGVTSNEKSFDHSYTADGRYEVSLAYQAVWKDSLGKVLFSLRDTLSESVLIEQEELDQEKPEIPIAVEKLEAVDISPLIKQEIPTWIWIISGLILGLWWVYEAYLFFFSRVVLDASNIKGPPIKKKLDIDRPEVSLFTYPSFEELVLSMREKKQAEAKTLDIDSSLKDTLRKGGITELIWKRRKQSVPYLILIEQKSAKDQLCLYLKEWAEALAQRDITVEIRFFKGDLSYFRKDIRLWEAAESLSRLAGNYAAYRLMIISEGEAFFDRQTGELTESAQLLKRWPVKALLSTRPVNSWDIQEDILQKLLPVFPFQEQGSQSFPIIWQEERERPPLRYWKRNAPEVPIPKVGKEDWLIAVKEYLGPKGFIWLCQLAIYPELHHHFILHYGHSLGLIAERGRTLSEEGRETLLRLLKLPWLRKGKLPDEVRLQLYQEVEKMGKKGKQYAKEARTYLINLLQREENQAPSDSWALQEQQASLAIYTFQNSKKDAEAVRKLKEKFASISPEKLKDVVSLQSLRNADKNPLALVLPRTAFKYEIPLFGIKTGVRALLALIPLAVMWLVYYFFLHTTDIPATPTVDQLKQETNYEKGLWQAWQGVEAFHSSQAQKAVGYFQQATDLMAEGELPELPYNLSAAHFEYGRRLYINDSLEQALSSFNTCCNNKLQIAGTYGKGLVQLQTDLVTEGIGELLSLDSLFYRDSSELYLRAENPQMLPNLLKRTYGSQERTTQDQIETLLGWMGTEISDLNQLLLGAQNAVERGEDSLAVLLFRQVIKESSPEESYYQQAERDLQVPLERLQPRIIELLREGQALLDEGGQRLRDEAKVRYDRILAWEPDNETAQRMLIEIDKIKRMPIEIENIENETGSETPVITTPTGDEEPDEPKDSIIHESTSTVEILSEGTSIAEEPSILNPGEFPNMILVKGGTFQMGAKSSNQDESPIHKVSLNKFEIAQTEVTVKQFNMFCSATGRELKLGKENHPVTKVSWMDAAEYCVWLSEVKGGIYRLPTEAEWEFAARGGTISQGYTYAGGNKADQVAWYLGNSVSATNPVGHKLPNELRLYDMSGNVWEWCSDWYSPDYYSKSRKKNPKGPRLGTHCVYRGGGWSSNLSTLRIEDRFSSDPTDRLPTIGFRPARTP